MLLKELSAHASPLNEQQLQQLQQISGELSAAQLAWVSGYLYGLSAQGASLNAVQGDATSLAVSTLTILYASQTGNAKGVAEELFQRAQGLGFEVNLLNISDYKVKQLKQESQLLLVASTNGEGEPPDDARGFYDFLYSKKAPQLNQLKYAVLALGDSSYEFFCQTGKDFDLRLSELGAQAMTARVDCDVDYEQSAEKWAGDVLAYVEQNANQSSAQVLPLTPRGETATYSKKNPYSAEIITRQKITGRDSLKDVRHIEIDLGESGLTYQAGDALGVWFENDPSLVSELLNVLALDPKALIELDGQPLSLQQALIEKLEITQCSPSFVQAWAKLSNSEALIALSEDASALREYTANRQVIDVLLEHKGKVDAQALVQALRKLTPRLYSIASSQQEVEDEVHLTVGVVSYQQNQQKRLGGASNYLAHGGDKVRVYVEENRNFRLPEDANTPIIMIGPGTGVAPFRAFMQQRDAAKASGDNWLFFGDQRFTQDFLYQVEWQSYLKSGLLTRLDVAFSRDQKNKIYVQDRIIEQGAELFRWLERGAHLYICGDAKRMAKDVHQSLLAVLAKHGQYSMEQAEAYLEQLRSAKRYQKDVY